MDDLHLLCAVHCGKIHVGSDWCYGNVGSPASEGMFILPAACKPHLTQSY